MAGTINTPLWCGEHRISWVRFNITWMHMGCFNDVIINGHNTFFYQTNMFVLEFLDGKFKLYAAHYRGLVANTNVFSKCFCSIQHVQYIPRNMHTVFALLCFVVVIHWLIFPYPSGLLHWHCGNLTIAPVPAKQPWWIWINTSCEFIMNDCITTTKQSTTKHVHISWDIL